MSKISLILCAFLALSLSGCAQELIAGNEAGGMVSGGDNVLESRAGALAVADAHCKQYGKVAQITGSDPMAGTMSFNCVKP